MKKLMLTALLAAAAFPLAAAASGSHTGGHDRPGASNAPGPAAALGRPGDPARATRTVDVELKDDMRFEPSVIHVKAGETIRFALHNAGRITHEMVLGSLHELQEHAREMRAHPGMAHAEPNQVSLKPGERGSLVWQFSRPGRVDFACTEPGHLEAGMIGRVDVAP